MHPVRTVTVTLALAACAPAGATAATIEVTRHEESSKGGRFAWSRLEFRGGPGESNAVTATRDGRDVVVRDERAEIAPNERCAAIDPQAVRCSPYAGTDLSSRQMSLGDGDDSGRWSGFSSGGVIYGGAGDDVLLGTEAERDYLVGDGGDDSLDGGGGPDSLHGGPGNDRLAGGKGDDELAGDDASAGSDLIDGGAGNDVASWGERADPVAVDLADPGRDGGVGEADTLSGVEDVVGGRGADVLRGDEGPNALRGGGGTADDLLIGRGGDDNLTDEGGDDRLVGKAGDDLLSSTSGTDRFEGGEGDDTIGQYGDSPRTPDGIRCGSGSDVVDSPQRTDFVPRECERVDVYIETLSPVYDDSDRYARFDYEAPRGLEEEGYGCGVIRLGEPAGSLGRVTFRIPRRGGTRVRVPLTARGRRALAPTRPVRVQVRFDIYGCPPRRGEEPDFSAGYRAAF